MTGPRTPWRDGLYFPKRYARILFSLLLSLVLLVIFLPSRPKLPPLYGLYVEHERRLPQHNHTLPYPEGKHAKFLFIANHGHGKVLHNNASIPIWSYDPH